LGLNPCQWRISAERLSLILVFDMVFGNDDLFRND
jgi:hypothetical protein